MIPSETASTSWQKSLYAIFVAQLLVMVGFSFVFPFMPLYLEQIGHYTNAQAAFWAGIAEGAAGIAMFFSAPLWGILADRAGRKPMVLRAMFGSAVVVILIALVPSVPFLITMRFFQGVLSGTMAAASALVASITPREKAPFAMGLLMTAVYVGNSVGPLLGGIAADHLGFKSTFFITAACLAIGGLIVLFLVKEHFERPPKKERASLGSMFRLAGSRRVFPLLIMQFSLQAGPNMVAPIIPLFMQQLNPLGEAATAGSSVLAGRLAQRIPLKTILAFSCLGTCLAYVAPMFAANTAQLTFFIALRGLVNGGIMTSSYAILSLSVPPSQQGLVFGVGQSANALGNGLGPTIGGTLGSSLGLKYVFGFSAAMYLLAAILVIKTLPKRAGQTSSGV
jgi:DHA1 family multidrug resistance protein-like MFS transporter